MKNDLISINQLIQSAGFLVIPGRHIADPGLSDDGMFTVDASHAAVQICKWDVERWELKPKIEETSYSRKQATLIEGNLCSIVSPDGRYVASGPSAEPVTVWLWEMARADSAGKPLSGHRGEVMSLAFSPDCKRVISGSRDTTVRFWDTETGTQMGKSLQFDDEVMSVAFSPNAEHIVAGLKDNTIRIWDVAGKREVGSLQGHDGMVYSVAFSPNGQYVVSGSTDKTVRIWDVGEREQKGNPLQGHTGMVLSVAFSPNGQHVVSGSTDKTVCIWDVGAGTQVGPPLQGHTEGVTFVAWPPKGGCVVAGSYNRTLRVWDLEEHFRLSTGSQSLEVGSEEETNISYVDRQPH